MLHLEKSLQDLFEDVGEAMKLRSSYWEKFQQSGLPSKKEENWKYTDIRSLYKKYGIDKLQAECNCQEEFCSLVKLNLDDSNYNIIVYDGSIMHDDVAQKGVKLSAITPKLSESVTDESALVSLNQAASVSGISLEVMDDVVLDKPVVISYVQDAYNHRSVMNYRNSIHFGQNAKGMIYERFINLTEHNSALNIRSDFDLEAGASCQFDRDQGQNETSLLLTYHCEINLKEAAEFSSFHLVSNSALTRYDFHVNLNGKAALFDADGIYILSAKAHLDYHFYVNHLASYTQSDVNFRGVVGGDAKAVFNAKAMVGEGLCGIKAMQNNRNLQLTKTSEINTKPELEIYSDDVVCSHGATVGQLDKSALFYLRSRGIDKKDAERLLMEGFTKEVVLALTRDQKKIEHYIEILSEYLQNTGS